MSEFERILLEKQLEIAKASERSIKQLESVISIQSEIIEGYKETVDIRDRIISRLEEQIIMLKTTRG